jgi:hypothetical protein
MVYIKYIKDTPHYRHPEKLIKKGVEQFVGYELANRMIETGAAVMVEENNVQSKKLIEAANIVKKEITKIKRKTKIKDGNN